MALVMYVDGVLKHRNGSPIRENVALYRALKEVYKIFLICDDIPKTDRWLKENKIKYVDELIDENVPEFSTNLKVSQAEYIRSHGKIELIFTADADVAEELLARGFRTLFVLDPYYLDPISRPDSSAGRKTWDQIKAEIDRQQELFLEDPRV